MNTMRQLQAIFIWIKKPVPVQDYKGAFYGYIIIHIIDQN